ncbi:MAG: hypothetical protein U0X92_13080 [Anaerolineales bacterium]
MKKTSKKLFLVCIVLLTVAACATQPPVPTNTPLPPFDTPTPFVVPTNTPIITNETATTQPTQATQFVPTSTDLPSVSTSTPLPPVTGIYNPYAVILVNKGDVLNIRSAAGTGQPIVGSLAPNAVGVNRTGPATSARRRPLGGDPESLRRDRLGEREVPHGVHRALRVLLRLARDRSVE